MGSAWDRSCRTSKGKFSMNKFFDILHDWNALTNEFDWIKALLTCDQDPKYHKEGNVWNHTKMVREAMMSQEQFIKLPPNEQLIMLAAATMHDIGKPDTTKVEPDGSISSKYHSVRGAIMSRQILWKLGTPFHIREAICNVVRYHMKPAHFYESKKQDKAVVEISLNSKCSWLGLMGRSDNLGRISDNQAESLDRVTYFEDYTKETMCYDKPYSFVSDHAKYCFFNKSGYNLFSEPYDDTVCEVVVMSGIPGSGKSFWIDKNKGNLPVVSLDEIRRRLNILPSTNQDKVVREAKETAKNYLRNKQSFIWDATNLNKDLRSRCCSLFRDYNAKIKFVYVESPYEAQNKQNKNREHVVPDNIIQNMIDKWEVPDYTEGHSVTYSIRE